MQRDSVSRALERRMAFSRMRERMTSASVGLGDSVREVLGLWDIGLDVPADFEGGRGHGGEFGDDLEDAVELALGEGCCYFGGYADNDSG